MKTRTALALVAALAMGSAAQAVDFTQPDVDDLIDYAAIHNLDLMYADLEVMDPAVLKGAGKVTHYVWTNDQGNEKHAYSATVKVQVPAKVPGLETLKAALNADVRIRLVSEGVKYAECLLAVQPVTSRTYVTYELQIAGRGDEVKPLKGVCDIDLVTPGIQAGIPQMHRLDLITSFVRHDVRPVTDLMEGYCY